MSKCWNYFLLFKSVAAVFESFRGLDEATDIKI